MLLLPLIRPVICRQSVARAVELGVRERIRPTEKLPLLKFQVFRQPSLLSQNIEVHLQFSYAEGKVYLTHCQAQLTVFLLSSLNYE